MRSMKMGLLSYILGLILLCLIFLSKKAHGKIHYHDFVLKEANFTRLCSTKSMLVVNGSFPGPVIRVHRGDILYVNVHNQGDYGLTLHWHGVKQPRNSWFDGPEYITQCPIEPGTNFTYEVLFTTEEGTLWWHAHSDWTRASVHGAIVIYPAEGTTYPFPTPDEEEILVLGSWYKIQNLNEAVKEILFTGGKSIVSDAYTINGQPGDLCPCSRDSTYRWMVDYGKTYLVRVVNAVMNVDLFFAIGGHNFTVVGIDGSYLKPINTDYIVMSAGQTMDLLLTTNQSLSYYYIAVRQYDSSDPTIASYDKTNVTAILMYKGNYTVPEYPTFPVSLPSFDNFLVANNFLNRLRSLASKEHPVHVPNIITTRMFIVVSMGNFTYKVSSSLNNISFVNPASMDILLAYYKNMSGIYTMDFPDEPPTYYNFTSEEESINPQVTQGTKVKMLDYNETIEIIFQGTDLKNLSGTHPMHMHGYSFYLMGFGDGNFDPDVHPKTYNFVDPPEQNTISVPKNGWATIRFKASNPGVWFWHCHFERHLNYGMNFVMIVKNGGTPETSLLPPPSYLPPCKSSFTKHLKMFDDSVEKVGNLGMT